jgi:hypothetical protein
LLDGDTKTGAEEGIGAPGKQSQITGMLLSNYILAVNLMLAIAQKYHSGDFETFHREQLAGLREIEEKLKKQFVGEEAQGSASALAYLVE